MGKRTVDGKLRELIVAQLLWPEPGEVIARPRRALTFASRYLRRAHMAVRRAGLAGLVTFHTHPLAKSEVGFSFFDDEQDPLLLENLQELWPARYSAVSSWARLRKKRDCGLHQPSS